MKLTKPIYSVLTTTPLEVISILHIVQFSGGAASAWVAKWVADTYGRENTVLLHNPTYAEHKDADRFRRQVSEHIGIPITVAEDGRDLWQTMLDHHSLPSFHIPFCTEDLKLIPTDKKLKQLEVKKIEFVIYNGLGANEWRRVQRAVVRAEAAGRLLRCPLFELKISNEEVKNIIRNEWKICLPEPYKYLEHNNCIPCFKAGKRHFYQVWKHYNEQFKKAVEMEKTIGHTVFKDVTLEELAKQWECEKNQISFEQWEEDSIPCMCAM